MTTPIVELGPCEYTKKGEGWVPGQYLALWVKVYESGLVVYMTMPSDDEVDKGGAYCTRVRTMDTLDAIWELKPQDSVYPQE